MTAEIHPLLIDVGAIAAIVVAVGGAVTLLARWAAAGYREWREWRHDNLAKIIHELRPNDGKSLRDAVDRIEARVADIELSLRKGK